MSAADVRGAAVLQETMQSSKFFVPRRCNAMPKQLQCKENGKAWRGALLSAFELELA